MSLPQPSKGALIQACETLVQRDEAFSIAYTMYGVPDWRGALANYETLARIIAYQQLSTKAAGTIWGRVKAHYDLGEDPLVRVEALNPQAVLRSEEDALRACGLSRPKIRHLKSIAEAIVSGNLDFDRIAQSEREEARRELISVKGIGPWTANIFLMSAICCLDSFPEGDVGLMEAYKLLHKADTRLNAKDFTLLAENWAPYRGVAAHLLWGWINAEREKNYST